MKNLLTLVLSLCVSTILFAQNPRIEKFDDYRIETYSFQRGKGDSVQYKLRDKADTLQSTFFYRSSKVSKIKWQNDSLHTFDVSGRLRGKIRLFSKNNLKEFYEYDANGQIQSIITYKKDQILEQRFNENGQLTYTKSKKDAPSVYRERISFEDDKTYRSSRVDTLMKDSVQILHFHDTIFYDNNKIYSVSFRQGNDILSKKYYSRDGALTESELPDSVKLIVFKDNVDCYYGLKNRRGDTIFKPQFDQIKIEDTDGYIKAFMGKRCTVLHLDGSPMKVPTTRLSYFNVVDFKNTPFDILEDEFNIRTFDEFEKSLKQKQNKLFVFKNTDNQYGIMTLKSDVVIPPQYLPLYSGIEGGLFFKFNEHRKDSVYRIGYINRKSKPIFPDRFRYVGSTDFEDYFILGLDFEKSGRDMRDDYRPKLSGLGKGSDESVLIEPLFDGIYYQEQSSLFIVTQTHPNAKNDNKSEVINGLYDPRAKKWLLEAKDYSIDYEYSYKEVVYFVLKNNKTQKYSIMDNKGKYYLKPSMSLDSIGIIDGQKGLFWGKKKNKYYFMDIKNGQAIMHSKGYEFIAKMFMGERTNQDDYVYYYRFLAKQNGKWGLIEFNEKILIPFEYDYASITSRSDNSFLMVKNNIASLFDNESIPNEQPFFGESDGRKKNALRRFGLVDNPTTLFFTNDTGKVITPPQYQKLNHYHEEYIIVEDAQKHQKIVFEETGEMIDKPLNYNIEIVRPKSKIMLVKDSTEISYGVFRTDGKELAPCINYGVAFGDMEKSTFFVKRDTPLVDRPQKRGFYGDIISFRSDSLNIEDNNWFLYDTEGQLLNKQPFRFPFNFHKGIGIGVQGEDFNLYKTDGTIYPPSREIGMQAQNKSLKTTVPNNFNNIIRIEPNNYYALFRNQGLIPTMMVANAEGQIFVDAGRYDGISRFYGKYALVTAAGKMGLIDSLGQEIIAPQDLRTSSIALIDSINLDKRFLRNFQSTGDNDFPQINTGQFELTTEYLKINNQQRTSLLNLILEERISNIVDNAQNMQIERSSLVAKADFILTYPNRIDEYLTLKQLAITDKSISFVYENFRFQAQPSHNFQKINNRWEKRTLYDIIDLLGEKREQLNGLMTQKIRALKDKTINCSNSDFLKQVENCFVLTEQGIDFCFESSESNSQLVIVSFTWDELRPFLK